MNVGEIKERQQIIKDHADRGASNAVESAICFWLSEIALQFAEANEHLAKIANPMMVVNAESPWVWLTFRGKSFVIHKDEVSGVDSIGDVVSIGMKGQPWLKSADGTVAEVCAKLGIPVEQ